MYTFRKALKQTFLLLLVLFLSACASYYTKNIKFNTAFQQGKLDVAEEILTSDKKATQRNTRLLYYMNRGLINSMKGNYQESNKLLEQVYLISDSHQKNVLAEGAAFLTNPNITEYRGEDFEIILIHYYKAFNFLKLGMNEQALVECRRMNIKLNALEDKYKSKNKYRKDAFVHLLMGIIYDANHDYNNAFIAYRNSLEIYENEYTKLFGLSTPEQLKKDLLRAAFYSGFMDELAFYERQFGMKFIQEKDKKSELVFLWNNGLGPVKEEWSLNFTIVKGSGGMVTFVNSQYGLNFPFYMSDNDYQSSGLGGLSVVRVAFPKYVERPLVYQSGYLEIGGRQYPLNKVEDVNQIAQKSLEDRMFFEMGTALLRMATKKAAEMLVRKQNQNAGAALSILNAVTEKADTRNWQTLPHTIYYSRVPVADGENKVTFTQQGAKGGQSSKEINFHVKPGETYFHTVTSLDFYPVNIY
jgi:hypothetical protein